MPDYEPTAARRIETDEDCIYDDCDNEADWLVEINESATIACCDACGTVYRLHPRDVEQYEITATEDK